MLHVCTRILRTTFLLWIPLRISSLLQSVRIISGFSSVRSYAMALIAACFAGFPNSSTHYCAEWCELTLCPWPLGPFFSESLLVIICRHPRLAPECVPPSAGLMRFSRPSPKFPSNSFPAEIIPRIIGGGHWRRCEYPDQDLTLSSFFFPLPRQEGSVCPSN